MKRRVVALALALGACAGPGGVQVVECAAGVNVYDGGACVSTSGGGGGGGGGDGGSQLTVGPYQLSRAGMWVNPAWNRKPFSRVMIVAGGVDPATRRAVEDAFAGQVTSLTGAEARPSYPVAPHAGRIPRDTLLKVLADSGADGVIYVRVTAQETNQLYTPPETLEAGAIYGGYSTIWGQVPDGPEPPPPPQFTTATVQSQLVRLTNPAVILVGKVNGPGLTPATARDAANATILAMMQRGVF